MLRSICSFESPEDHRPVSFHIKPPALVYKVWSASLAFPTEISNKSRHSAGGNTLLPEELYLSAYLNVSHPAHVRITDAVNFSSPAQSYRLDFPATSAHGPERDGRRYIRRPLELLVRNTCPVSAKKCQISHKFYLSCGMGRDLRFLALTTVPR